MQAEKKSMTRTSYLDKSKEYQSIRMDIQKDPFRLQYHLQPPMGWLNDPNGLCQIGKQFHIYFQYTPFNPEGGTGLWGHMTTEDFIRYEEHEPAIYPDSRWDANGAYSGSAYEQDGIYYFFYTGNIKYTDKKYDYITEGREQNVILITTKDGYRFSEKKMIMTNNDFPIDMSKHVRDPQIIRKNDSYYMILGARDRSDKGAVLLYESSDLWNWRYKLRFTTPEKFGYMWECPNFVEVGGKLFLIVCPQGVEGQGLDYANAYQCGYFPLKYQFGQETYELGEFRQLDRGFDFYAPQVLKDHCGRALLIGWMGMPDSDYGNEPTVKKGWQHALTLPRELYISTDGTLAQKPVEELNTLRKNREQVEFQRNFKIHVSAWFEMNIHIHCSHDFCIKLRESAVLSYEQGVLLLNLEKCGCGRKTRGVRVDTIKNIKIMSDSSSLEIFINDGEEVFTTRIYDSMHELTCEMKSTALEGTVDWYELVKSSTLIQADLTREFK